MLVERARQRLAQHRAGTLPARLAADWERLPGLSAGLAHRTTHACPACGEVGDLEGEDVIDRDIQTERVSEDDYDVWVDLTVAADHFSCDECRLVLDDYELLQQAGLPLEFAAVGEYGEYGQEDDYGND